MTFIGRYRRLLAPYARTYAWGLGLLFITNALSLAVPWLVKGAVDALAFTRGVVPEAPPARLGGLLEGPLAYALALAVAGAILAVMRAGSRVLILGVGRRLAHDLKARLYERLLRADPAFYGRFPTGEIMSRCISDVQIMAAVAAPGVLYTFNALFMFGIAVPYLFSVSWELTALVLLPYPALAYLTMRLATRVKGFAREAQAAMADLTTHLQETLTGMEVVRAFTLEAHQARRFARGNDEYLEKSMKEAVARGVIGIAAVLTGGIGTVILIYVGGARVINGDLTYGDLALFLSVLAMVLRPTIFLGWVLSLAQRGQASLDRIEELLDAPLAIEPPRAPRAPRGLRPAAAADDATPRAAPELAAARDAAGAALALDPRDAAPAGEAPAELRSRPGTAAEGGPGSPPPRELMRGHVTLRGLSFRYPAPREDPAAAGGRARREALQEVSLSVPPGGILGLVGRIGAGKSTVLRAIPRFLAAPPGTVLVDDVPVEEWDLAALRGAIGYVPQDGMVFSLTLAENAAFGLPGASQAEVLAALGAAELEKDLDQLDLGLETVMGERGVTLSGGQRQRLAIARAVLVRPRILLLDDALSMVDAETAVAVLGNLRAALPGTTVLAAAHRTATLLGCDEVLVLEAGRVVERGRPDALLASEGRFWAMHERQRLQSEILEAP